MKPYPITKGLKLPPVSRPATAGRVSAAALTLAILAKGDSFLVTAPLDAIKAEKVMRDFTARERNRRGGRSFTSRRTGKGVRIWRVK